MQVPMEISRFFYINLPSLLLFTSIFVHQCSSIDIYTEALLSLKADFHDDHNSLQDWSVSNNHDSSGNTTILACSWSGVTCNTNKTSVIALDLSGMNLGGALSGDKLGAFNDLEDFNLSYNSISGKLPIEIFNLTRLRSLDISRNNFSGQFPGNISFSRMRNLILLDAFSNSFSGPLPVNLPQIDTLEVLNLAGSYFNGQIPSGYGSFKSLKFIHLAGNFLTGVIPPELGSLQTLTHMEIGYNTYEGGIPWQFGNMSEITYLDIADANLSGFIPKDLSNLTKIESLFLFKNQFAGLIPWEFGKMGSLTALDLSDNLISGPIPESFAELKNLRLLSLFYNSMNGTVPDSISELPSLETLLLWNNYFSGPLPTSLGKNLNLKWVDVSTNYFIGAIPPGICSGGGLIKLIMFSNNFSGTLPPSISGCSSLVRLRLEDNSFSGDISLNFTQISYIDLSRNQFTGSIPSEISQASELQYFNVSWNPGIQGTIPGALWSLLALRNFSASFCNISGTIPPFGSCRFVSMIELAGNNLWGSIPGSISNCQNLETIDFSSNRLTGSIPEELAGLPTLSAIDLSENNLTGQIPEKFAASSRLRQFNVSFNDISGSIPSSKLFISLDRSAFLGNMRLCGPPLRPCSSSIAILGSKGTSGKLILVLLLSLGLVVLAILALGLFYFHRASKKGQWKMVPFNGLPRFKPSDVLRSFDSTETSPNLLNPVCKAVLPTGITVLVKRLEWGPNGKDFLSGFVARMGDARHPNLTRLLGVCHNRDVAYLLYDYLPNGNLSEKIRTKKDWKEKCRIVIGIARGLCFLHHDCYPAIPHGDLKSSNVGFDENMEPQLVEFGFKYLIRLITGSSLTEISGKSSDEFYGLKEQLEMDVYNFGEIILEVLTNGRLINAGETIQAEPKDVLLKEICMENSVASNHSLQEDVKSILEVALLCTRSRGSDRPSARDVLKLLPTL